MVPERLGPLAGRVEPDDAFESLDLARMHVRCSSGDPSKSRGLEFAELRRAMGGRVQSAGRYPVGVVAVGAGARELAGERLGQSDVAPRVVILPELSGGDPRIMELKVAEGGAMVARATIRFADEEPESADFGRAERRRFVMETVLSNLRDVAVESALGRSDRALERRDGLSDVHERALNRLLIDGGHRVPAVRFRMNFSGEPRTEFRLGVEVGPRARGETGGIFDRRERVENLFVPSSEVGGRRDVPDGIDPRRIEFSRVFDRLEGLTPKGVNSTVPEEPTLVTDVLDGRCLTRFPSTTLGHRSTVGECSGGIVARRAAQRRVGG